MQHPSSAPSSVQKPKRKHLDEFLPLYKKFRETGETNVSSNSKNLLESPRRQKKQAVDISQINIDGTNLNYSGGNSIPRNKLKVTSTPLTDKKLDKLAKKHKKNTSTVDHSLTRDDDGLGPSKSKSIKRSKSVSFLQEEKEQAIVKKSKSEDSHEGATGDTPQKNKKQKYKKKKSVKSKGDKSETVETHSIPDHETEEVSSAGKEKKTKKKEKSKTEANEDTVKPKKAKKHQEHNEYEGELASKSPKTEFIADNLENLNLGASTHSLTNLIDLMVVVDKEKKKKLRKTENREKILSKPSSQNENGDGETEVQTEKKKWVAKRWNKQQIAERDQNTTIHVDNLPVSLLKGNFKRVLIDHFAKYGLSRSVGEPVIQNEEVLNPVFTTKMFFNNATAAAEALEMDSTNIAGNKIRVSSMRPMTDTVLVLRIYGKPDILCEKYIRTTFHDVGLIRNIKPMRNKKKTMATVFVEFDGPAAVQKALKKCENLTVNGKKIMTSTFSVRTQLKRKKRGRGKSNVREASDDDDSDSDDDSSDE